MNQNEAAKEALKHFQQVADSCKTIERRLEKMARIAEGKLRHFDTYQELADLLGCTRGTLWVTKTKGASKIMALKLEAITGIDAHRWAFPRWFEKSPWDEITIGAK